MTQSWGHITHTHIVLSLKYVTETVAEQEIFKPKRLYIGRVMVPLIVGRGIEVSLEH